MARIRTIKPKHWDDKELPNISLQAHLLWIACWNFSDDEGIFEADPILIRSQVFPRRTDIRVEQVSQWLDQLVKARFIIPFKYKNESYYINRTFGTHQKIDKPQPSKIPSDIIRITLSEHSENDQRCIVMESNSNGRESMGIAPENKNSTLPNEPETPPPIAPPPSKNGPPIADVIRFFSGAGGTEEMARAFWNKWESTDWMDGYSRIKNWPARANNYIASWHKNDKKEQYGAVRKQTTTGSINAVNAAFADVQRDLDEAMRSGPENT